MRLDSFSLLFKGGSSRTVAVRKNVMGSLAIKGVSILISFLIVPLTLGYVSTEIYGVWLTLSSILHWFTFMDVGFTRGLKNKLTEALANEDYVRGSRLVSTTYFLMIVIFVPLASIIAIVTPLIDWSSILNVSASNNDVICKTIQLLSLFLALQMILNVFVSVVAAYQKVAISSLFAVIGQAFALIIIALMTKFVEPSLINLAFAYSLMPIVIVLVASIIYFKTSMRNVAPSIADIQISMVKDIWSLGYRFFIIQIQMIVLYQTTNFLISYLAGPVSVAQYNVAYKLFSVFAMLFTIVLEPLWPAFTDAYTKNDFAWMRKVYSMMTHFYYLLLGAIILFVLISPFIYHLWLRDILTIPLFLTCAVAIYTLLHCWDTLQVVLLNGIGKIKLQTRMVMVGIILHIPLSLFLGYFIGLYGVLISMCVINIIYLLCFTIQIRKVLNQEDIGIWSM